MLPDHRAAERHGAAEKRGTAGRRWGGAVNRLTGNPEPEADVGRARPRRQSSGGHFTSATDPSPVAFGGVIFLSHSQFVHSDTGRVRYWTGS